MSDLVLANAVYKLRWSAGSEWSAHVTPAECAAILEALFPSVRCDLCGGTEDVRERGWRDEGGHMLTCEVCGGPETLVVTQSVSGTDVAGGYEYGPAADADVQLCLRGHGEFVGSKCPRCDWIERLSDVDEEDA